MTVLDNRFQRRAMPSFLNSPGNVELRSYILVDSRIGANAFDSQVLPRYTQLPLLDLVLLALILKCPNIWHHLPVDTNRLLPLALLLRGIVGFASPALGERRRVGHDPSDGISRVRVSNGGKRRPFCGGHVGAFRRPVETSDVLESLEWCE